MSINVAGRTSKAAFDARPAPRLAAPMVCVAFLAGCMFSPPTAGALAKGQFAYVCASGEPDVGCANPFDTSLPQAIAVGASFQIGYEPNAASGGTVPGGNGYQMVPASSEFVSLTGSDLVALRAGYVALLAQHTGLSTVDDFVHVKFSPMKTLRPNPASLTLLFDETKTAQVDPIDANGTLLAGQIPCQWQVVSGAQAIVLNANASSRAASVQGLVGGNATVRATCLGLTADIPITVIAPPSPGNIGAVIAGLLDGGTHG